MPALGSVLVVSGGIMKGAGMIACLIPGGQAVGVAMIAGGHTMMVTGVIVMPAP